MGKTIRAFPKALVLIPPKNVSYQTQSVLIPCPPHWIAPLSERSPLYHQAEADKMVCLKQQVITCKSFPHNQNYRSQLPDSGHQKKAVPLVNKNNIDKLNQQSNLESHSGLLFRNRVPHTGVLYPGDHQTNISVTLRSDGNKVRDIDGPAIFGYKTIAEPSLRPSEAEKVTSQLQSKKLNRARVRIECDPDTCSKSTTIKRQSSILNPVARDQTWKRSYSDHQGKHNLDFKEQAKLKVDSQHQVNIHLSPDDQSTHLLNRHQKIPSPHPETKAKNQLNKRSRPEFCHDYYHHQDTIPLSHQHQTQIALDLVSEDSLPLKHTHVKSEGPIRMSMICGCQRKSQPFIFQRARTPPCCVCSSKPRLLKTLSSSDCWTTVTLPVLEHHSKPPFHPKVQDIPFPKKFASRLTETPKSHYYRTKATQISGHQDEKHRWTQNEQNRGTSKCLHNIKPHTTEGLTRKTKFADDIISSIPKEKIKSDFSKKVHMWQMKDCLIPIQWPSQYMSANDSKCSVCSSWIRSDSPHSPRVNRRVAAPTASPGPEKKSVKFFLKVPPAKASPSSKAPGALSPKLRPLHSPSTFPSCSLSDPVPLSPLRPKLTWLDFIRYKYHQPKEEKTSPSQKLFWGEIPFTSKNIMKEISVRQNACPMSLLKRFESRINN